MSTLKPGVNRGQRKVGLDKPCKMCGKPIYYAYQGPYEGVCGRCTDRMKRKPRRRLRRAGPAQGSRRRNGRLVLAVVLMIVAVAAAVYAGHDRILDLLHGLFR